jgi:TrkA domain protein
VLSGVYFKPTIVEEIEKTIGEFVVDWITLSESSPAAGRTIADLQMRKETGMSVIAVVRGGSVETSPDPYVALEPGDRLVVVGAREDFPKFIRTYG